MTAVATSAEKPSPAIVKEREVERSRLLVERTLERANGYSERPTLLKNVVAEKSRARIRQDESIDHGPVDVSRQCHGGPWPYACHEGRGHAERRAGSQEK